MQLWRDVFIFPLTSLGKLKKPLNIRLGSPEPGRREASSGRSKGRALSPSLPRPVGGGGGGTLTSDSVPVASSRPRRRAADPASSLALTHAANLLSATAQAVNALFTMANRHLEITLLQITTWDKTVRRFRQRPANTGTLYKRARAV